MNYLLAPLLSLLMAKSPYLLQQPMYPFAFFHQIYSDQRHKPDRFVFRPVLALVEPSFCICPQLLSTVNILAI